MTTILKAPSYGYGARCMKVTRILKAPGEAFDIDEPIYEVETEKATNEIEAFCAGRIVRWRIAVGDIIAIDQEVADIEVASDEADGAVEPLMARRVERVASSGVYATISVEVKWQAVEFALEATRSLSAASRLTTSVIAAYCLQETLKAHPLFGQVIDRHGNFARPPAIALGVAIARPDDGLGVAVLPIDPFTDFNTFVASAKRVISSARDGIDEALTDVPVILSDMSLFGIRLATPIVAPPSVATLFVGEAYYQTIPDLAGYAVGRSTNLALTFDHRVANGVGAARFLDDLRRRLEGFVIPGLAARALVQTERKSTPFPGETFNWYRPLAVATLKSLPVAARQLVLEDYLAEVLSILLGMAKSGIDPYRPLSTLLIDSLIAVQLDIVISDFSKILGGEYSTSILDLSLSELNLVDLAVQILAKIGLEEEA
jgi:pyruvate/2-oxoglutarate dehydrogenase complex dihydrolipoamide acyltransferase (E2) component